MNESKDFKNKKNSIKGTSHGKLLEKPIFKKKSLSVYDSKNFKIELNNFTNNSNNNESFENNNILVNRKLTEKRIADFNMHLSLSRSNTNNLNQDSIFKKISDNTFNYNNENSINYNQNIEESIIDNVYLNKEKESRMKKDNNIKNTDEYETEDEINIPKLLNKSKNTNTQERELFEIAQMSYGGKKVFLFRIRLILMLIDIVILSLSGVISTVLYFEHFSVIRNKNVLTDSNNRVKIMCLLFSSIQVILLILRDSNIRTRENVKFFLNYSENPNVNTILTKSLFFEMFIHILQPYPFLSFHFQLEVMGRTITYSVSMLLYLLCIIRFYYIFLIINQWVVFSTERSKRIIRLLMDKNPLIMIFKSMLKYYGLTTILILFLTMTYLFSLIFKILEDYEYLSTFSEITNCIWYILVTLTKSKYYLSKLDMEILFLYLC